MPWSLEIHHIDVVQGDSTLIIATDGNDQRSILIDGGRSEQAQSVHAYVAARLAFHGINRLDTMIASHYDIDHSKGLTELLVADNRAQQNYYIANAAATAAADTAAGPNNNTAQHQAAAAAAAAAATCEGAYSIPNGTSYLYVSYLGIASAIQAVVGTDTQLQAATKGFEEGVYVTNRLTLNPPLVASPPMQYSRYRTLCVDAAIAAVNAGGNVANRRAAAYAVVRNALNTITSRNSRFDTQRLYNTTQIFDRGDGGTAAPDDYQRAVAGLLTQSSNARLTMPALNRNRMTPNIGAEVMWNLGNNARAAPANAPTLWCVAANAYVRPNQGPIAGNPTNVVGLGFILRFNNFFYYTGGDLNIGIEDLVIDNITTSRLPDPQNPPAGRFPLPNHICCWKCGHHGADNSTSQHFVDTSAAAATFISTGGTAYEHPAQAVVNRLHGNANIQNFYFTNLNFDTNLVPASQGLDQLAAVGNKSRVAGDNTLNPHVQRGNIAVYVSEDESNSQIHPPAVLNVNQIYHRFRVEYWDEDANGGAGQMLTNTHHH